MPQNMQDTCTTPTEPMYRSRGSFVYCCSKLPHEHLPPMKTRLYGRGTAQANGGGDGTKEEDSMIPNVSCEATFAFEKKKSL